MLQGVLDCKTASFAVAESDAVFVLLLFFDRGPVVLADVNGDRVLIVKVLVQGGKVAIALEELAPLRH